MQLLDFRDPKNRGMIMFGVAVVSVIGAFFLLILNPPKDPSVYTVPLPEVKELDQSSDGQLILYDNGDDTKTIVVDGGDYTADEALELFELVGEGETVEIYIKKDTIDYSEYAEDEIDYEGLGLDPYYTDE